MSSGKRFDKTFARKKKDTPKNNNEVKEEEQLLTTKPQQNGKSENSTKQQSTNNKKKIDPKPKKENNNNKEKNKKKKENNESELVKPKKKKEELKEPQKKKRKLESGVQENGEKDVVLSKLKKSKASKNGEKASENKRKEKEKEKEESFECAFPTARVARIVKSEGSSDYKLSGEAVFLINKATEKFVELFSIDAYGSAVEDHKSFVGYKHLASAVCKKKQFDFLSDFVPEKVKAEKALAERKPVETPPC